jgi:hypothetical protein
MPLQRRDLIQYWPRTCDVLEKRGFRLRSGSFRRAAGIDDQLEVTELVSFYWVRGQDLRHRNPRVDVVGESRMRWAQWHA